jgi:dihydropteroate synthase
MDLSDSIAYAHRLVEDGAEVIDIGGVKAGPGPDVEEGEELERVLPLVSALASDTSATLSVDTGSSSVARAALHAGARVINDVTGLADPTLAEVVAQAGASLVLMHNGGQLRGRPRHPRYADVVHEVMAGWERLVREVVRRGMKEEQIVVDPGLDFGKTTFHSLELMDRLDELTAVPWPVLVAPSRKDVVGETLGLPPEDRLEGTLALVALAVLKGAAAVRVHDVRAAARTVAMVEAVTGRRDPLAPARGLWE